MKLVTAERMRELEQRADAAGTSFAAMMERAGTGTAQAMMRRWDVRGKHVLALVGPGNNGGDGLVCARALYQAGARVTLYVWRRVPTMHDVNWEKCLELKIPVTRAEDDLDFARLKAELQTSEFVVDALLGTGVTRPMEGTLQELTKTVREAQARAAQPTDDLTTLAPGVLQEADARTLRVIAVDLPSGLNPDTGALDPAALYADLTVTFAFPKPGLFRFRGADAVGELVIADIGIPREWAGDDWFEVATNREIAARLPKRERDSNKGTYGKAMLACGSMQFTGAPVLAGRAAGRAGAGLVTLAVPQTIHPMVAARVDETTFLPLVDRAGDWRPRAANDLLAQLWDTPYDALLVGCGLGRGEGTAAFLQRLLEGLPQLEPFPALVLDADALNLLAEMHEWWNFLPPSAPTILTPHPGEMARLLGAAVAEVQADRAGIARRTAQEWNAVVVLKGAFTVVASPDGRVTLIPFANPALATAGTGDVLAGTIVGLLGQYRARARHANGGSALNDAFDAAVVGAYLHGLAGERVAANIGRAGTVAGDVLAQLPAAIRLTAGG